MLPSLGHTVLPVTDDKQQLLDPMVEPEGCERESVLDLNVMVDPHECERKSVRDPMVEPQECERESISGMPVLSLTIQFQYLSSYWVVINKLLFKLFDTQCKFIGHMSQCVLSAT